MDKSCAMSPPQLTCIIHLDEDTGGGHTGAHRRPSTASLSRFRSCPELTSALSQQESPVINMDPMTNQDGQLIHTSPMVRNSLCVDLPEIEINNIRSVAATPSPPSTPESQRKDVMATSFISHASTLGLLNATTGPSLVKDENLRRLEELRSFGQHRTSHCDDVMDSERQCPTVTETDDSCSLCTYNRHHIAVMSEEENVDKCTKWLQSIKLNSSDKIKSRSQMQLTPT